MLAVNKSRSVKDWIVQDTIIAVTSTSSLMVLVREKSNTKRLAEAHQ